MTTVRVGKKHIVVIPAEIRKKVGLKEGDLLDVRVVGEKKITLELVTSDPFETLGKVIGEPYEEKEDEKMAEEWLKKRGG